MPTPAPAGAALPTPESSGRSRVTVNLFANGTGSVATSLIQFAIIPVYIRLLGPESYGLVGVQTTLQALAQLLDFGVSASINRELARRTALGTDASSVRDMVRTLEVSYGAIGAVLGILVFLGAPLAERWLQHAQLSALTIRHSVQVMALLLAAQWPLTFYQGALLGLQRHGLYNSVRVGCMAVTAVGAWVVLTRVERTPVALFAWQAVMSLVQVGLLAVATWWCLPRAAARPRVRRASVAGLGTFALGMTGVTATALLLSQGDRIVASRVLPLDTFGYYMLGATLANALLYTFVSPVYTSVFPRLSSLVAVGDVATLRASYRRAWGVMAVVSLPAAAVLCLFAYPLILVWTRDPVAATATAPIAALLVAGTALHGLLLMSFGLQLAHGWTRVALTINASLCTVALPLVLVLASRYGAVGAAATWPIVNVLFAVATITVTHGRLGAETGRRWLVADIAWPAGAAVAVTALCRYAIPVPASFVGVLAVAGVVWAATTAALVAVSPLLRRNAADLLTRARSRGPEA